MGRPLTDRQLASRRLAAAAGRQLDETERMRLQQAMELLGELEDLGAELVRMKTIEVGVEDKGDTMQSPTA